MRLLKFIATKTIPMKPRSIPITVQQFKILSRYGFSPRNFSDPQRAYILTWNYSKDRRKRKRVFTEYNSAQVASEEDG